MEKQLHVLQHHDNCSTVRPRLPEENRHKIEGIFADFLIGLLSSILEEVKNHDK
ncbi:MAG: hypothetical protein AB9866_04245 [Syntrophobacteraceae bacterium]